MILLTLQIIWNLNISNEIWDSYEIQNLKIFTP